MKILTENSGLAFFRFHLSVGTRLALRTFIPSVALIFAGYYLFGPGLFHLLIASFIDVGFLLTGLISAAVSLTVAGMAARRVCLGLDGWIRHLPSSSNTHRRLAGIAIFIAQFPILAILGILAVISSARFGSWPLPYLAGLPLLGLSAAVCVLPVKQKLITRPLAALACVFVASGDWRFILGGIVLTVTADMISGRLSPQRRRSSFRRSLKGLWLMATVGWRALRFRLFLPFMFSLPVLGATTLFLSNNSLNPLLSMKAILLGGGLSITIFLASTANMLASRRPPWPWARSLPWSAKQRIVIDSAFLSFHAILLLVLVGLMNIKAVLPLVASLPLFAVYASSNMRKAFEHRMGVLGIILLSGTLGALLLCLMPLISVVYLALTPLGLKAAVREDRSQKVSRWLELHHLAAGDSLSWSKN